MIRIRERVVSCISLISCLVVLLLIMVNLGISMMYVDGGRTSFENYPIYAGGTAQNRVRIAVGPHGDIYAIWKEGSNVVFSMSSDRGRSWLAVPVTVAQLNGGNDFAIAVDDDDNVYVAIANIYDMNNPTYYWGVKKLIRNGDGTIRFEYHNSESHGTQTISNVNLATGGASGNTYAYMVYRTTDGSGYDTIRGRRSTSWSNEITIVSGTSGVSLSTPSISIYDNKVAVVYNRNSADIVLALDEGSGFVYTTINSGSSTQPGLVFEKDDIYIVWKQNYDIKVCHYRYNLGWSVRVITIVDDGGSTAVDNPAIALDKDGKVIVSWEDSRYSSVYSTDIYFDISSDNASSFSVDERINRDYSGARAQVSVSICSKYGYGPYLAWEDYRSGVWKVYFEDIGLGRPYKIEEIGSIGGVSLPEYRINDIVNYTGIEMKDDTCDYNFGSNIWTVRNPGSSPSVRTESALATIPGTTKALLFGGYNANGYLGDVWIYDHTTTAWSDITPTEKSVTDDTYNDFSGGTFSSTEVQGYSGLDGTVVLSNGISGNRIVSSSVTESGSSLTYDLLWVQSTGTLELTTSSAVCTMNVDTIIVDGLIKADGLSSTPNGNAGGDATSTAGGGGGGGGGYGGAGGRGATSSGGISGGTGGETITGPSTGRAGGNGGLGYCEASRSGGWSGKGGGQININARVVVIGSSGKITANGYNAWSGTGCTGAGGGGGGGGGSGGCIQIKSYDFKSNTGGVLQVKGGNGGNGMGSYYGGGGGGGGGGRIFIYYENMYVMEGSCDISGGTAGSGGSGAQNGGTGVFTSTKQSYTSPFTYSSSGEYVSTAKYLSGGVGAWKNITWSSQVKGTGSLKFQLRTGNTISELESAAFVGPDGTSSSYYTTSGADITNLPKKCYLQYKAYFTRGSTTSDFVALQNITIRYVECIPSPRAGHAMCKVDGDDKVLLFGGNDGSQQFGDTYIYDNSENKWVLGSSGPSGRTEHAIASIKGTDKILLFGGWWYNSGVEYLGDTWIYDVSDGTWTEISVSGPCARAGHALASIEDGSGVYRSIILFGGYNSSCKFGDTWIFRWDTVNSIGYWVRLGPFLEEPLARANHTLCSIYNSNLVMLYGGENDRNREDTWIFDLVENVWKRVANGTAERTAHAMTMIDTTNYLLVFGGNVTYHYTIFVGEGYVSILKCTANNPKLRNLQLASGYGGSNCKAYAATIRAGKAVVVGSSSAQGEIWNIDIRDEKSTVATSITWSTAYTSVTEVCYDGVSPATLMMAKGVAGTNYLLKASEDLSSFWTEAFTHPINAICAKGDGGYYIFAYDSTLRENIYYTHNGYLAGTATLLTIIGGPRGQINDAATAVIGTSPIKTFTYLAASASISDSSRGLYKLIREDTSYSIVEIDVNGDGNSSYFNYSAIDICADSNVCAKNITVLAAGANYYTKLPAGGSSSGFFAVVKEKLSGNVWKSETFAFECMRKNEFCATKIVDHKYENGTEGYVAGLVNSPSLFAIKSRLRGSFTLITLYSLDPPSVSNVRISIPGDSQSVNRMNEQFVPTGTNRLEFWVNVTEPDTLADLQNVKFQAWYDDPDGNGIEDNWTMACMIDDRNGRVEIICNRNEDGSYDFNMIYPTSNEVVFDPTECSAIENGNTVQLKFSYIPLKESRYSRGGNYGDGVSCANTWNFQFVCTDGLGERNPIGGGLGDGYEFGYQRVTSLIGAVDRSVNSDESISPGTFGMVENFTIVWSANNDYKLGVWMNSPLVCGENVIEYENVMVCEAKNETEGYPGNDFEKTENIFLKDGYSSFEGPNVRKYWYGSNERYFEAPNRGNEQKFETNFMVYVPVGTKAGNYMATVTYIVEISSEFSKKRVLNGMQIVGTGETTGDYFGWSVASAGDVNGDGYDDVLIGAYGNDENGINAGKVYVYNGSAFGLSNTAWVDYGDANGAYFGWSVASAGDVNGDGYGDVLIGAYGVNTYKGRVFLYYGSAGGLVKATRIALDGEVSNDYFGWSVASAGDVNGDGYSDVIVGAPENDAGGSSAGKVYVYKGGPNGLDVNPIWTMVGEAGDTDFGYSVSCAGDVNGDGYDDIIVGSTYDGGGTNRGKAYVYLGSKDGIQSSLFWSRAGDSASDFFGYCVASAGDVNGDGYDDIIIGANQWLNPMNTKRMGKAYIFLGGKTGMSSASYWEAYGEYENDMFGNSVASVGRYNGDRYPDIIVGAYLNDTPQTTDDRGKAYLFVGRASGFETNVGRCELGVGGGTNYYFGFCVANAGDVNGDGYDDILVCACGYDTNRGRVYVYL